MKVTDLTPIVEELKQGHISDIIIVNTLINNFEEKIKDIMEFVSESSAPIYIVFIGLTEEQRDSDQYQLLQDYATVLNLILVELI